MMAVAFAANVLSTTDEMKAKQLMQAQEMTSIRKRTWRAICVYSHASSVSSVSILLVLYQTAAMITNSIAA